MNTSIDFSLPGRTSNIGILHPISININKIINFFMRLGFDLLDGPEIECSYNNFDVLNIPLHHPARSKQDSFWINKKQQILLRTHTTSIHSTHLKNKKPPIKYFSIGKVFRNDNDSTHTPMFHQLEGVMINKNLSLCNLKEIIYNFLTFYFNKKDLKIRFRPSYFPFTEPSIEVDIFYNKWLEVLGCGLLHINVLKNFNINPNKYNALAFGIGIERLIMIKYNLKDIRVLFENNIRFLKKFKF